MNQPFNPIAPAVRVGNTQRVAERRVRALQDSMDNTDGVIPEHIREQRRHVIEARNRGEQAEASEIAATSAHSRKRDLKRPSDRVRFATARQYIEDMEIRTGRPCNLSMIDPRELLR